MSRDTFVCVCALWWGDVGYYFCMQAKAIFIVELVAFAIHNFFGPRQQKKWEIEENEKMS